MEPKICRVCGAEKQHVDFYDKDNTCKECRKASVRRNRAARIEQYRAYEAYRYRNDPRKRAAIDKYAATENGIASRRRAQEKWDKQNPIKKAAHVILNNHVRDGKVHKPDSCSVCGKSGCRIEGHHHDYSKPLDVVWLCRKCHYAEHHKE